MPVASPRSRRETAVCGEDVSQALADMNRLGDEMSARWELFAADPIAADALARGDLKKARDQFIVIVDADPSAGGDYLYRATRTAVWAGDAADAKVLADRYRDMGEFGPVADARSATIRAGLAALEGRPKEALVYYRDALRGWRDSHLAWDEALTGIDMAQLLDPTDPEVAAAIASTRAILERLRAWPFIERLDNAVNSAPRPGTRAAAARQTLQAEAALSE
jgi:tetratricopeptide (TPR) repeat protein